MFQIHQEKAIHVSVEWIQSKRILLLQADSSESLHITEGRLSEHAPLLLASPLKQRKQDH